MFSLSASHVKTVAEFRAMSPRKSADAGARAFARKNMVAVVLCGDDSAISYLYDVANDRISRRVYKHVEWSA